MDVRSLTHASSSPQWAAHAPAAMQPGTYRNITGNLALAYGLITASHQSGLRLFLGSYPITPASDILHELSKHKNFNVMTFQAEDEIAAVCAARRVVSEASEAVVQLLEMGGTETMATDEAQLMARLQAEQAETDEMCALRLFRQFADELGGQLGERVPPEILNDPVRYEAFVRQRFEQELLREGSQLSRRAESLWAPSGGGSGGGSDGATTSDGSLPRKQGLLERMKRMPLFASRVGVEDGAKPLLLSDQAKEG